jgi:dipeptidyl aminopeptidase/acylaminoacyl peptidase
MNMKKLLAQTFFILVFAAPLATAQDKRAMTFDDVMALKTVGGAAISPDGKMIAYTVSYSDMKENERRSEIWMVAATGGTARKFTSGKNDSSPLWSPDGHWLAFLSTRPATSPPGSGPAPSGGSGTTPRAQVFLISPFGGEAEQLTESKTGVSSFAWSADSRRLAYVAQAPLTESEEKRQKDKDDAIVIDENFRYSRLWTIDVASRKSLEVAKENLVISDPQFSPDGATISFTAVPTTKADDGSLSDIYLVKSDGTGTPWKLHQNEGPDSGARWSPDGRWISFSSRESAGGLPRFQRLYVIPAPSAQGAQPKQLAANFDGPIPPVIWAKDSSTLFFAGMARTSSQVFSVPAAGGDAKVVTSGEGVITSYSISASAAGAPGKLAFTRSSLEEVSDVFVSELKGFKALKLTDHNPQLRQIALGRGEVFRWKSKDGMEIEGILILPVGYQAGRKYPTFANIHGGPSGVWTQSFPASYGNYAHVLAGKGWVIFLPNVRGSSGYGEKFLVANVRDWGGGDFVDIQTGLDELVKRGIADPDRLGQSGWSYGGYMTAWTLTQTNRFKAVMVGAGLTNMFSMYSTNDLQRVLEGYFGGQPWDDVQAYSRASAMTFIKKARTPTLIMHGQNDQRVPIGQAQELYMGLRKNNIPVSLVFYPREGHGLQEPRHQLDKMNRESAWFAKYVLGAEKEKDKVPVAATAK